MIGSPVVRLIARSPAGSRPRPIGVMSTIVPIPLACPSRTSAIDRSTSVKPWPGIPGESISRWSCASTTPSVAASRGPVTVMTWASGTSRSWGPACGDGLDRASVPAPDRLTAGPILGVPIVSLTRSGAAAIVGGTVYSHRGPMRDVEPRSRRPATRVRTITLLAIVVVLVSLFPLAGHTAAATIWTRNLFAAKGFVYQDPYYTACTAASVMHMLNTIAYRGTGGYGFRWTPYTV